MPLSPTKRTLTALAVLVCLAILAGGGFYFFYYGHGILQLAGKGQAPGILSELPSDAPVVAYIDVAALRKLQNSPLAAILGLAGANPAEDRDYLQFKTDTGFDYTRDLNAVGLAFWPAGLDSSSKTLAENRVLAIADGRFDEQKIKAYALRTGKVITRGATSIYAVPGNPPVSFQFLSPTRIAIASGKNASDLVGASNPPQNGAAMQARTEHVAGTPIFAVARADNLPASFYANFHNSQQLEHLLRSVQNLTFAGQPDGEKIQATLDAQCDSTKNAFELATLLDGARIIGSMALADPKARGQMTKDQAAFLSALMSDAKISHQDTWVRLSLAITPEMLGQTAVAAAPHASTPAR